MPVGCTLLNAQKVRKFNEQLHQSVDVYFQLQFSTFFSTNIWVKYVKNIFIHIYFHTSKQHLSRKVERKILKWKFMKIIFMVCENFPQGSLFVDKKFIINWAFGCVFCCERSNEICLNFIHLFIHNFLLIHSDFLKPLICLATEQIINLAVINENRKIYLNEMHENRFLQLPAC